MYKIAFGKSGMEVPTVAVGCMRIGGMTDSEVSGFIESALECGGNFFDHADIYCGGKSEAVFGRALTPDLREKLIIQTKCGIVPGTMYDFSYEHIIEAVEPYPSRHRLYRRTAPSPPRRTYGAGGGGKSL